MIGCNDHGQPPLSPERKSEPTLDLPDFYLDLMFGDLPVSDCTADGAVRSENLLQDVA